MDLNSLINFDQKLLLLLNGSDSLFWDSLMKGITSTVAWIPIAVILLYIIIKNNNILEVVIIVLMIAFAITLADQFSTSFCKPFFARFRPAQDPNIMYLVDIVDGYRGGRYGFISSHASNTFAVCVFLSMLIRSLHCTFSLVLWASLCSYSRIYLGVHYPGDIFFGLIWGCMVGLLTFYLYRYIVRLFIPNKVNFISSQYTKGGYAVYDIELFLTALYLTYIVLIIRSAFVLY